MAPISRWTAGSRRSDPWSPGRRPAVPLRPDSMKFAISRFSFPTPFAFSPCEKSRALNNGRLPRGIAHFEQPYQLRSRLTRDGTTNLPFGAERRRCRSCVTAYRLVIVVVKIRLLPARAQGVGLWEATDYSCMGWDVDRTVQLYPERRGHLRSRYEVVKPQNAHRGRRA
jgi:hypothetical protein